MRKALKQIFESVSTLRSLFVKLMVSGDSKTSEISKLTKQVGELETELKQCTEMQAKAHRTPSVAGARALDGTGARKHFAPSDAHAPEPGGAVTRRVAPPDDKASRHCAAAVPQLKDLQDDRSRGASPPETIKHLQKTRINPSEIKVWINTLKSINSGVLIETNSKGEIEVLDKGIQAKCREEYKLCVYIYIHTYTHINSVCVFIPTNLHNCH
jgi:hypothetical protein